MTVKEAVEIARNKLKPAFESFTWKGELKHPEKTELIQVLQTLIDLAEKVESAEMPKKKERKCKCEYLNTECECILIADTYNQAIDDCKLYIAKRDIPVERMVDIIVDYLPKDMGDNERYDRAECLAQALKKDLPI